MKKIIAAITVSLLLCTTVFAYKTKSNPFTNKLDYVGADSSDTGDFTGGTDGSVVFVHPDNTFAQDNANLHWDDTNSVLQVSGARGSDLVTNGTFTGSASGWTVGSGFAYSSNSVSHTSNGTNILSQSISIGNAFIYELTFTISNWTVGSVTPSLGAVNGTAVSANGTYVQQFKTIGTNALGFTPTNTSRFTIDSVSVKQLTGGEFRSPGIGYLGEVDISQNESNSTPGTSRHILLNNNGSFSWIENKFSGNTRQAIGFTTSGDINLYSTGGNGTGFYSSNSLYSYNASVGFYSAGYGQFSNYVGASQGVNAGSTSSPTSTLEAYGSTGFKTANLTTSGTLDSSYTDVSLNGDNNNICTGTPTYACSHWDVSTCGDNDSHGGCSYNSGSSCSVFNGESGMGSCLGTGGCSPESVSCGGAGDSISCYAQNDSYGGACAWDNHPIDCSTFGDDPSCGGHAGTECTYTNPISSFCDGSVTDSCTISYFDEGSCNAHPECSWDGVTCNDSISSCSTWNSDSTNCTAAGCTFHDFVAGYCTGSIDSFTCDNTFYNGTCDGTFGAGCQGTSSCTGVTYANCGSEAGCTGSTGIARTFPSDSGSTSFYRTYRFFNRGSTADATLLPNGGQTVNNGASSYTLTHGHGAIFTLFYFTDNCSTKSGSDSTSCTNFNGACSWDACTSHNSDETGCDAVGYCSYDSGSGDCTGTGACNGGAFTISRDWSLVGKN